MRFLPVNLNALLVELDDLAQTLGLYASLGAEPIAGIDETVPAARTLLITFRPAAIGVDALVRQVRERRLDAPVAAVERRIEIPVRYVGDDLAEVAALLGIDAAEVVRRHTGRDYTVAFSGFAPGFAYLSGGDAGLAVPRRAVPRTRIEAGAVGLAGAFSGVYPRASPGGWQIIGVTETPMWDLSRPVPALLQPGDTVRFVDVTTSPVAFAGRERLPQLDHPVCTAAANGPGLQVRAVGLQALFQDAGRTGLARQGVSASGAMDRGALQAANRLVGNLADAGCVETVYGGFQVVGRGDTVVAVTGADAPVTVVRRGGAARSLLRGHPFALADGDTLTLGEPHAGIRSYLAVRGGFAVTPVLGSVATDTLAHVGPPPIATGDLLALRDVDRGAIVGGPEEPAAELPTLTHETVLDVVLGPRTDWFTAEAVELLSGQSWEVTPRSNRIGLRLAGSRALERIVTSELPSEGTCRGSIQVPPSGQPVLFMADHPLTGGYPVIGSVATHHLDRAGQVPVGAWIRFRVIRPFMELGSR